MSRFASPVAALALLGVAACGSPDPAPSSRKTDGAGSLADALASRMHAESDLDLRCPEPPPEATGQSRDCRVRSGDHDVVVRATRTAGGGLDVVPVLPADELAGEVSVVLAADGKHEVEAMTCEGELVGEPGATADCTGMVDGEPVPLRVRCARARGLVVEFAVWEESR